MRGRPAAAIALLWTTLASAGCLGGTQDAGSEAPDVGTVLAPVWQVGDWWSYTWESEVYARSFDATVVVGAVENGTYHVGMPVDDYSLMALLFHLPAVGPVSSELAYGVHEVPFEPLRFPLTDGATWETTYISSPVTFVAHAVDQTVGNRTDPVFHITNEATQAASGRTYSGVYDPKVRWFTSFERVDLDGRLRERITLSDRGSGFEGTVRLLDDIRVLYLEGRSAGALGAGGAPDPPVDSFDPPDELDLVFAACVYGDAPGVYDVSIDHADGNVCTLRGSITGSDVERRIAAVEVPNVAGAWQVRLGAVGQGLALGEVLGYTAREITLGA